MYNQRTHKRTRLLYNNANKKGITDNFCELITRRSLVRVQFPLLSLRLLKSTVCVLTNRFFMSNISLLLLNVYENVYVFNMKSNYSEPKIYTGGVVQKIVKVNH
jgi:hypothetical protein